MSTTAMIPAREIIILLVSCIAMVMSDDPFNLNFQPKWGYNHLSQLDQGRTVQLLLDPSSGSGFISKHMYCNGVFKMRMKIPEQKTEGVVVAFYLISKQEYGNHDELDFEFIGTKGMLQTNIFTNDGGNREQKIQLWFDPSKDFHTYEIDLSSRRVVFRIDNKPIRVFPHSARRNYISKPMHVEACIWNGTWAGVVDWQKGPFKTYYQGFDIQGTICDS